VQDSTAAGRSPLEQPIVRAAIALVLLGALGAAAVFVRSQRGSGASGPVSVAGAPTRAASAVAETGIGALDDRRPIKGEPAPDFALRDADGNLVKLSDLRGKVVWLNFWATWCDPCKKELPDIEKLYQELGDRGLEVLEINWQEDADTASAFFGGRGIDLPLLLDTRGSVYDAYRLQGLPDSFFIDREGNIAAWQYGSLTEAKMRERLATAGLP
jgi:peroxiredoxin